MRAGAGCKCKWGTGLDGCLSPEGSCVPMASPPPLRWAMPRCLGQRPPTTTRRRAPKFHIPAGGARWPLHLYAAPWIKVIRCALQGDGADESRRCSLWRRAIYRIQISAFSTHLHKAISAFSDEKRAAQAVIHSGAGITLETRQP